MINLNKKENTMDYLLNKDAGHTPRSGAIARVIDLINSDLNKFEPQTKREKSLYNQLAKINNGFVKKFNEKHGDASGGYIELIK